MVQTALKLDDFVIARYKTGQYVAKIIGWRQEDKTIVEILAVMKHPRQGDLHNPNDVDVVFHQRKALAFHEKAIVNTHSLQKYTDAVPDYSKSLKEAVNDELEKLKNENTPWAEKAVIQLENLMSDYFN